MNILSKTIIKTEECGRCYPICTYEEDAIMVAWILAM
jgi:hypothetical protein